MTSSHNLEADQSKDEEWEYLESEGESVQMENVANAELEEPRIAVSKYIPLIEYDSDDRTLSITTKLR